MAPCSTVADLKKRLGAVARIPSCFQSLVIGTTVLSDTSPLGMHCQPCVQSLSVLMVVSLDEETETNLNSSSFSVRVKALEPFLAAGLEWEVAVIAVLGMLGDESACVRCEALRVLAEMTLDTTEHVIASVTPEAANKHRVVSILTIAAKENMQGPSIGTLAFQMGNDPNILNSDIVPSPVSPMHVRFDALKVLALLGQQGSEEALDSMIARLQHEDEWLRCAACLAMAVTDDSFDEVVEHLEHEDPRVRCLAVRALPSVAKYALDLAKSRLVDENSDVRAAANNAMAEMAYFPQIWKE